MLLNTVFFPFVLNVCAELYQKRYMRRDLTKPDNMTMPEFMGLVQEINEYFPKFPKDLEGGNTIYKLSQWQLVEISKYAIADDWQNTMHLHNVDPLTGGVQDFIEFCERLETLDHGDTEVVSKHKRSSTYKKRASSKNDSDDVPIGDQYCLLHRSSNHSTENCCQLKAQVKPRTTSSGDSGSSRTSHSKSSKQAYGKPQYSKQELNTIINAVESKALKGTSSKCKRSTSHKATVTAEQQQELNQFKIKSISDSDAEEHMKSVLNSDESSDSKADSTTNSISSDSF